MRTKMTQRFLGLLTASLIFLACAPKTVIVEKVVKEKAVTQVVEVEREVTKIVEGTPVVEKVVETRVVEVVVEKVVEKEVTRVVETVVTPTPVPMPSAEVYMLSTGSNPLEGSLLKGCRVTYKEVEYALLDEMIRAGQESFIFYTSPTSLRGLVQDKVVVPLDDVAGIEEGEYIDVLVEGFTYGGRIYGVPRDFRPMALYYNVDLFKKAGVPEPDNDWTWDDLKAAAQAIQAILKDVEVSGLVVTDSPASLADFILRNGGQVMSEDLTKTMLDSPKAIEAGEFYTGARQVEGWAILPEDAGVRSYLQAFGQGHVAMMIDSYVRTRYLPGSYPGLNYGLVQSPAGWAGGEGNLIYVTGYAVSYSPDPVARQAAQDAIACLTSEVNLKALVKSERILPSRWSLGDDLRGDPTAYALFSRAGNGTLYGWGPHHGEVSSALQDALSRIFQEGWPVEDSFREAAEQIRKIIAE